MSFIEGIGDDFLYAIIFFIFIGIVTLAWFSTHVNQINFPPTLFIIERRTQRRINNEESERTSPPSRLTQSDEQIVSSPSINETQTEHETDNESSEPEEFHCEQPVTPSVQEQIPCEHSPASDDKDSELIRITIKFLNETRKEILVNPNDTIFKVKQLHFAEDVTSNKMIRFIYQGRELQDRETLRTYNIRDQTTIHCQITARRIEPSTHQNDHRSSHATHRNHNTFDASTLIDTSTVNIPSHFVLFLFLILCFIWYLRIKYRVLFSPISTVILILITLLFLIFTCGSLLTTRRPISNPRPPTITIAPVQHAHLD